MEIRKYSLPVALVFAVCGTIKCAKKSRYVHLEKCEFISALQYECCAKITLTNFPQNEMCLEITVVPNELALHLNVKNNGDLVYSGKIDPSVAPICPLPTPLCLTLNHVNIANKEVCSKLTVGPITLLKFPCFRISDGKVEVLSNNYVR